MRKTVWAAIGVLAVLIALLGDTFDLVERLLPSRERLEAELIYGWFGLPPQFDGLLSELNRMTDGNDSFWGSFVPQEEMQRQCGADGNRIYMATRMAGGTALKNVLDKAGSAHPRMLGGYWRGIVRNAGTTGLRAVRLRVPMVKHAMVAKHGQVTEPVTPNSDIVEIGDFQPGDHAVVTAWTTDEPNPPIATLRPALLSYNRPVLTHADGVGKVKVLVPVGRIGQVVSDYWILPVTLLLTSLVMFGAFRLGHWYESRKQKRVR